MSSSEFDFNLGTQEQTSSELTLPAEEFPGIYWEQVGLFRVPMATRHVLNSEIDKQRHNFMACLGIMQKPDVVIMQDPKNIPDKKIAVLSADTLINEALPRGIIRLFFSHMELIIAEKVARDQAPSIRLAGTMGHEGYHIKQWNTPAEHEAAEIDLKLAKLAGEKGGIEAQLAVWNVTPTEIMAKEFERYWIEHWMDFPKAAK
jgi:hypothetical protein